MAIPTTIRLNGNVFARRSVAVRIGGLIRFTEIDSINWSDELPTELVAAMNGGGVPLGKAKGNYTCSASISVYADAASKFEALAKSTSIPPAVGLNNADANFQIAIAITEDARSRVVLLANCSIKGQSSSVGSDGAALVEEYQLQPTLITRDGKALVNLLPAL